MNPILNKWKFNDLIMPDIWYKDDEIYSLMQPFKRPRHIVPAAYDYKINFWSNIILKYCKTYHVIVINEADLEKIFHKDFKSTGTSQHILCGGTVLSFLLNENKIKNINDISANNGLLRKVLSTSGWLMIAPLKWSFNKFYSMYYGNDEKQDTNFDKNQTFYIPEILNECISEFLSWFNLHEHLFITNQLKVIKKADFDKLLESYSPDYRSRSLIEHVLKQNQLIETISLTSNDTTFEAVQICFTEKSKPTMELLTESQKSMLAGLVTLQAQLHRVSSRYELLEKRLNEIKFIAKRAFNEGRKEEAKKQFVLGKRIEQELERARGVMINLESLIMDLEGAGQHGEVIRGMQGAAAALKAQNFSVDQAKDTVDELEDALAEIDEINTSINQLGDRLNNPASSADGDQQMLDLERELNDLLVEEDKLPQFPEIPRDQPSHKPLSSHSTKQSHIPTIGQ